MFIETDLADLLWGKLALRRVAPGIERAGDRKSGAGTGFADETQDGGIINERLSRPVLADLGEEPMVDGIPLGGAGRIMAGGDEQPEGLDQLSLKGVFPEVGVCSVAAAVVGEDEQAGGIRRAETTFAQATIGGSTPLRKPGCCERCRPSRSRDWPGNRRRRRGWRRLRRAKGNRGREPARGLGSRPGRDS